MFTVAAVLGSVQEQVLKNETYTAFCSFMLLFFLVSFSAVRQKGDYLSSEADMLASGAAGLHNSSLQLPGQKSVIQVIGHISVFNDEE